MVPSIASYEATRAVQRTKKAVKSRHNSTTALRLLTMDVIDCTELFAAWRMLKQRKPTRNLGVSGIVNDEPAGAPFRAPLTNLSFHFIRSWPSRRSARFRSALAVVVYALANPALRNCCPKNPSNNLFGFRVGVHISIT